MAETLPATLPRAVSPAQQAHIVNIIRRAARAEIMPRFRSLSASDINTKSGPDDLVTAADTATEAMITRTLRIAFPDALIVGEESVAADPTLLDKIADAPVAFIIDPIDGTWNYARGLALFGVILAVTQFGKPSFGLIYDPVADDWAIADDQGKVAMETASSTRPLKAAMGKPLEALAGFIPLNLFPKAQQARLASTLPSFARTAPIRCSAHEYRLLAQGHMDFSISGLLYPWDHAAGALICANAGCHVEMLDGGEYSAARRDGNLLVAPDRTTWNRLKKVFAFLLEETE